MVEGLALDLLGPDDAVGVDDIDGWDELGVPAVVVRPILVILPPASPGDFARLDRRDHRLLRLLEMDAPDGERPAFHPPAEGPGLGVQVAAGCGQAAREDEYDHL